MVRLPAISIMAHTDHPYHQAGYSYLFPNSPQSLSLDNTGLENGVWTGLYVGVTQFDFMRMYALTLYIPGERALD